MDRVYLSTTSDGRFQSYSKEKKEGYTQREGKEGYTKIISDIEGSLESIRIIANHNLKGSPELLELNIVDGKNDIEYRVQTFLRTQSGGYTKYVEHIIRLLPNIKKDTTYSFRPYNFIPEDSDRAIKGFSVKKGDEKVEKLTQSYKSKSGEEFKGDVPSIVWERDEIRDKWVCNDDEKIKYLKNILEKHLDKETSKQTIETKHKDVKEEEEDTLPF